ncbi:2-oxo-hept-3-ene-1,7-dioate hydratase [Mesorhizobium robiniae]|uniref:2-oxo-hept-3-ene-1,7-dioate hydratase n=1 Tax=Mesorhizobium robiniae TaxID=559315 RepID=A0ABV2GNM4_9HYPH
MLTREQHERAACILVDADKAHRQATQLSTTFPEITIEDSYLISSLVHTRRVEAGAKLIGHKIGLTSKAMQASSQIEEPDFGYLLDSMLLEDGAKVKFADFCVPRVELELAFVLSKPLAGPGIGLLDVLRATEYVVPSIEIIDARVLNPRRITDTVADNGAAAGIVIGGRPVGPAEVDLRWVGGIMYRNGEIEETGLAAGVLGHPARAIAWLANKVGRFGTVLQPGHIMLSGSFIRPVFAQKGDTLQGDFGPLGSVAVQFV